MPKTRKTKKAKVRMNLENDKDYSNLPEPQLKAELEAELKRLQEEYRRQKEITGELEQKRESIQTDLGPPVVPAPANTALNVPEYPEIYSTEQRFDQAYLNDVGIDKEFIDSISKVKDELSELKVKLETKLDREAIENIKELEEEKNEMTNDIARVDKKILKMSRDIEKTDQKLSDILLDLGFEESLEINKIPYHILALVYETILNDIINRIKHSKGSQDTETMVLKILENIRSHTSGGELFKYEQNRINIPDLPQYLAKKLISPKQTHITYNSIMERLLEYVPGYIPKNFKAMIKIKSQEYALDTINKLDKHFESFTSQFDEIKMNVNKFLSKYKNWETSQQFYKEELKNLNIHITNLTNRIDKLPEIIDEKLDEKLHENLTGLQMGKNTKSVISTDAADAEPPTEVEEDTKTVSNNGFDLEAGSGTIVLGDEETEASRSSVGVPGEVEHDESFEEKRSTKKGSDSKEHKKEMTTSKKKASKKDKGTSKEISN